ncbi:glyoxylate/hydroxypyruvate reductase A [Agrobacterium larrymoorei]|uniref:Glyoxylate/hydroxypyruvate reductase A n=1 Tax=Agrobacterium larrymoorei TaxID=160699 RepID=A0AAJ2B6D7_9HYPH|nr:glyoxylate/hydroxypyruvate reductase A [Agrobacterium larrymoorei]MDR6101218.1 glyoxylate/hydroxypyruvate reductase A [Agrobacterium larrymoorei]
MTSPIAYVSRSADDEEATWIETLSEAMPREKIVSIRQMREEQRQAAEIAIVANPDPADIAKLPGLKWIHSLWAGVERIVSELGPTSPPIVRLTDPELARVMGEAVLAWTYYLHRNMPAYRQQQEKKIWKDLEYRHPKDVTVGLIGLGLLGTESAKRLLGAGFNVMGWSRSLKDLEGVATVSGEEGLHELLAKSDIAVCLVPLTAETRGLINAGRLQRMKPGASIINFARGAVIVADDLLSSLDSDHIAHAVLDVFEKEPLDQGSPLWSHPNVTVLPHISAPTDPGSSAAIVAQNIHNWRKTGELPITVDMQRGY